MATTPATAYQGITCNLQITATLPSLSRIDELVNLRMLAALKCLLHTSSFMMQLSMRIKAFPAVHFCT
jgi:hypothetical protein